MKTARKCKYCKKAFKDKSPVLVNLKAFCDFYCAANFGQEQVKKEKDKEFKELKAKVKSRSEWLKEAQAVFNRYIRLRDDKEPCISCQRHHSGQYHAGHYRSVGACPELRFNELNVHKQCAPCNNHLSGNAIEYRINLVGKIGADKVEWLEGSHEPLKLSIEEIKQIKKQYQQKIKEMTKERTE